MSEFPRPTEGGNSGDGLPLVLGDDNVVGDFFCATGSVHVLDWDGDGEHELVCTGGNGDFYSFKFVDFLPDGTPIVDKGMQWGMVSRRLHLSDVDQGLTGSVALAADFDGDGQVEVILASRGYSLKPTIVKSLKGGVTPDRIPDKDIAIKGGKINVNALGGGTAAAIDWDGDGRPDLVVIQHDESRYEPINTKTGFAWEDQRDRYNKDGSWRGALWMRELHLYRNTSSNGVIEFTYAGQVDVELPRHAMFVVAASPSDPEAGLLFVGYFGDLFHMPFNDTGDPPKFGGATELFTLRNEPFNRSVILGQIEVSDVLEKGRFDIFASDNAGSVNWCRYYGQDADGHPIYDTPRKLQQRDPFVASGFFSVVTVGDWRDTGMDDLLVGGIDGYIHWYKTLSTDPLKFALPERVRQGAEEIRRLARANPSAGHHWGGSQGPYDGDTGGYSNPVLADWDGDGLLDLIVSDMVGLFDWYPNWGTKKRPELGPPQRLHVTTGGPVFGPWRQQPGIGDFDGTGLPCLVAQDLDLDLTLYRRAGRDDLSALFPGEKLRYEDGSTIKTHGVYTWQGGDGRGRTKINVVDWDHDGLLDLLIGVGPQHGSPFRTSMILYAKNVGTNKDPVFKRPIVLVWDKNGHPLEFWRHSVNMAPVDWDGDGRYELIAGADIGHVWYWKPKRFGNPASGDPTAPMRAEGEEGFGSRDD